MTVGITRMSSDLYVVLVVDVTLSRVCVTGLRILVMTLTGEEVAVEHQAEAQVLPETTLQVCAGEVVYFQQPAQQWAGN